MRGGVRSRRCWGCAPEKFWGVAPHGIFDEPKRIIVQCAAKAVILMQVPFLFFFFLFCCLLANMQQLGLVLQKLPFFLVSTPSPKIIPRCLCKHMKNMKYWVSSIQHCNVTWIFTNRCPYKLLYCKQIKCCNSNKLTVQ